MLTHLLYDIVKLDNQSETRYMYSKNLQIWPLATYCSWRYENMILTLYFGPAIIVFVVFIMSFIKILILIYDIRKI